MGYMVLTVVYGIVLVLIFKLVLPWMVQKRLREYQDDLVKKHYEEVENVYRQMKGWKHDYHHHLQAMRGCISGGQLPKLEDYLKELDGSLDEIVMLVTTGNHMVDAMLNSKLTIARTQGILVNVKVYLPSALKVSDVNLCIVIGNLLDNAMEACRKMRDRENCFIRLYMDEIQEQFYLSVSNSMEGRARKRAGWFESERENHGFGLRRVQKVVKENQGYLNCQSEDGVFAVEVMMPL